MVERIRLRMQSSKRRRQVIFVTALLLVTVFSCVFYFYKDEFLERGLVFFGAPVTGDLHPVRGAIYDRNYKELAVSLDRVSVYARTREVVNHKKVASRLAPVLGKSEAELLRLFKSESLRVWLAKNIDQAQEDAVQQLDIQGIELHRETERFYPQKNVGAHLIGFVEDDIGLSGVEYHFNRLINEYGIVRSNEIGEHPGKEPGEDDDHYLVLTIDLKIQNILEKYLVDLVKGHSGRKAGVMLMDVVTGDVVGAASYPSFDPNKFHDFKKEYLVNRLSESIPIPQTFRKVLWEAAFIQAHQEKNDQVIPWSLAPEIVSLGAQLRLWEKLELNKDLRLDFVVGQTAGDRIKRLRRFPELDLQTVPEVATPLHLLTSYARLINGGRSVLPHVVDRLRDKWGEEVLPESAWMDEVANSVVEDEVSNEFNQLLSAQMEAGPLSSGFLEDSAVFLRSRDNIQETAVNHLLISTIPAKQPKLILLVSVVDSESGPEYAVQGKPQKTKKRRGRKAKVKEIQLPKILTPPAKKIISSLVIRQEVMKDLSSTMSVVVKGDENYIEEDIQDPKKTIKDLDELGARLRTMPDLRGYSLRKSLRMLQQYELDIKIEGTGVVVSQSPSPGAVMGSTKQSTIVLERKNPR